MSIDNIMILYELQEIVFKFFTIIDSDIRRKTKTINDISVKPIAYSFTLFIWYSHCFDAFRKHTCCN